MSVGVGLGVLVGGIGVAEGMGVNVGMGVRVGMGVSAGMDVGSGGGVTCGTLKGFSAIPRSGSAGTHPTLFGAGS